MNKPVVTCLIPFEKNGKQSKQENNKSNCILPQGNRGWRYIDSQPSSWCLPHSQKSNFWSPLVNLSLFAPLSARQKRERNRQKLVINESNETDGSFLLSTNL